MNACGPQTVEGMSLLEKMCVWILNKVLDVLSPHFFQASCQKHDEGYKKGGDEKRRKQCDLKFHQAICNDIYNLNINYLLLFWYLFLSIIFYLSVRKLGYRYFNYTLGKT